jgi:hypothetical protein
MIRITIGISDHQEIDIGIDAKQTIVETMIILEKKGICTFPPTIYVKVERTYTCVSILSTYEAVGIIEGDVLRMQ